MKGLFKSKPRTPVELVHQLRHLLSYVVPSPTVRENKRQEKICELGKIIHEIWSVLYGEGRSEPAAEACTKLIQEIFKEDILRLLITCLPNLDAGVRVDITQVIGNLQTHRVNGRYIASEYMEHNTDLLELLMPGYDNLELAISMGKMLRKCIQHQVAARYILESDHMEKFFIYLKDQDFDIRSDAEATFRELLTRHKSTAAEYLSKNYEWFFHEYNLLLQSDNYITRRTAVKLLGEMLLDRSNTSVMIRYVSSLENMIILMNLLRDSNKTIQLEAFHVFKLFPANQNKPPEIVNMLIKNRSKLLRFFGNFGSDIVDEQFQADKTQIMKEIATLEPKVQSYSPLKQGEEVPC